MEQEHRLFFTRRSENAKRDIRRLSSGYESLSKWVPFYLHAKAKYYCFYCALYNKLSYARILIGSHLWSIGGQTIDDVIIKLFFPYIFILYYIKQIYSKLPCICSVIDHRWRQNAVRTSVTHSAPPGSCATFLFLPHFDVICDLLLNRRTTTWNLFVK